MPRLWADCETLRLREGNQLDLALVDDELLYRKQSVINHHRILIKARWMVWCWANSVDARET
jgi:hypothetical protein